MPKFEGWFSIPSKKFKAFYKTFGEGRSGNIISRPLYGTKWQIWLDVKSKHPFEEGEAESIEDAKYLIEDFLVR